MDQAQEIRFENFSDNPIVAVFLAEPNWNAGTYAVCCFLLTVLWGLIWLVVRALLILLILFWNLVPGNVFGSLPPIDECVQIAKQSARKLLRLPLVGNGRFWVAILLLVVISCLVIAFFYQAILKWLEEDQDERDGEISPENAAAASRANPGSPVRLQSNVVRKHSLIPTWLLRSAHRTAKLMGRLRDFIASRHSAPLSLGLLVLFVSWKAVGDPISFLTASNPSEWESPKSALILTLYRAGNAVFVLWAGYFSLLVYLYRFRVAFAVATCICTPLLVWLGWTHHGIDRSSSMWQAALGASPQPAMEPGKGVVNVLSGAVVLVLFYLFISSQALKALEPIADEDHGSLSRLLLRIIRLFAQGATPLYRGFYFLINNLLLGFPAGSRLIRSLLITPARQANPLSQKIPGIPSTSPPATPLSAATPDTPRQPSSPTRPVQPTGPVGPFFIDRTVAGLVGTLVVASNWVARKMHESLMSRHLRGTDYIVSTILALTLLAFMLCIIIYALSAETVWKFIKSTICGRGLGISSFFANYPASIAAFVGRQWESLEAKFAYPREIVSAILISSASFVVLVTAKSSAYSSVNEVEAVPQGTLSIDVDQKPQSGSLSDLPPLLASPPGYSSSTVQNALLLDSPSYGFKQLWARVLSWGPASGTTAVSLWWFLSAYDLPLAALHRMSDNKCFMAFSLGVGWKVLRTIQHAYTFYYSTRTLATLGPATYTASDVTVVVPTSGNWSQTDEDFMNGLSSILANQPGEVIITTMGMDKHKLMNRISGAFGTHRVKVTSVHEKNMRRQFLAATDVATTRIICYANTRVGWEPDFLQKALVPFEDEQVGLVGSPILLVPTLPATTYMDPSGPAPARSAEVLRPVTFPGSVWQKFLHYLYALRLTRYNYDGCARRDAPVVSGRTALIRTAIVQSPAFRLQFPYESWIFGSGGPDAGMRVNADEYIARFVSGIGLQTVFCNPLAVHVEVPCHENPTLASYCGRLVRDYRGAHRHDLTTLFSSQIWLLRLLGAPLGSLRHYSLVWEPVMAWLLRAAGAGTGGLAVFAALLLATKVGRQLEHLRRNPGDWCFVPGGILFAYFCTLLRIWAFVGCWSVESHPA
ncbi:unnamed protein product [Diplocarpon coronariae]